MRKGVAHLPAEAAKATAVVREVTKVALPASRSTVARVAASHLSQHRVQDRK